MNLYFTRKKIQFSRAVQYSNGSENVCRLKMQWYRSIPYGNIRISRRRKGKYVQRFITHVHSYSVGRKQFRPKSSFSRPVISLARTGTLATRASCSRSIPPSDPRLCSRVCLRLYDAKPIFVDSTSLSTIFYSVIDS